MPVTDLYLVAYGHGLSFRGRSVQADVDSVLEYYDGVILSNPTQTPEQMAETAAFFCSNFGVPVSNGDPAGCMEAYVAGIKGEHVPCGGFLLQASVPPPEDSPAHG